VPRPCGTMSEGLAGMAELAMPAGPGGGQEEKSRCFSQPTGLVRCKKKALVLHVTRW
jgi:hypothetical protein